MNSEDILDKNYDLASISNLITSLKQKDSQTYPKAISILCKIGEPAVSPLIQVLQAEDKDVRYLAAKALEKIGKLAVQPLIDELGNNNSSIRICAVETLGKIGDSQAVISLISTLMDDKEDEIIREYAVYALENIGKPALKPLISVLKDLNDSGAVAPLMAAAHYNNENVRSKAIDSLEKAGVSYYHIKPNSNIEQTNGKIPQVRSNNSNDDIEIRDGNKHFRQLFLTDFFKEKE